MRWTRIFWTGLGALSFALAASSAGALDTDALVGAWLMDDSSGKTVSDSSGNGLDGEAVSGDPQWVDGKYRGALEFDGDDMVTVPDDSKLDLETFTLAAWVNIPAISGAWQIIASKENRNPTGRNYGLFAHINSGFVHYSFTTNNGWKSFDAKTPITDGQWHHVAGTYDGTTFTLYLNGAEDASTKPGTKPDSHDNVLFIGGCDIGGYWMTGAIDELALFSRALSAEEVNELKEGLEGVLSVDPRGKMAAAWASLKRAN
ncbi:MAG: LamG domain-containing protein [Candidatus Poribacteria bacterium]|nr:LamG domain-containing protein [Candidatus Poribacteria bacterium]